MSGIPGFAAGSRVLCFEGPRPIEAVRNGMRVMSQRSWRQVMIADAVQAPSVAVRCSDGKTFIGALNAMAWTKARKWVALWQLDSDSVLSLDDGTAVTVSSVVDAGVRWTYSLVVAKRAGFFVDGRLCA